MRLWCVLAILPACVESDPKAGTQKLSELSPPHIGFSASVDEVSVEISSVFDEDRKCAVLDDSFDARVNGRTMQIISRGQAVDSPFSTEPCAPAVLQLDHLDPSPTASIGISYPNHSITIDLADMLVVRTAQLVPEGAWTFTPGQHVTVQWTPATDLALHGPVLPVVEFVSQSFSARVPFVIDGDHMDWPLPETHAAGHIEVTLERATTSWPCAGAHCEVGSPIVFTHDVAFQ